MTWFEWDDAKAKKNQRKHGISFDIACHVFDDPDALVEQDRMKAANFDGKRLEP
jgi:uncharacterized DUF497 family protein